MKDYKQTIHRAYCRASCDFPHVKISEDIGVDVGRLYAFASRGTLGHDALRAVRHWLIEHEYLEPDPSPKEEVITVHERSAPYSNRVPGRIAAELKALTAFLESPDFTDAAKIKRFCAAIRGYEETLDEYEALAKKK